MEREPNALPGTTFEFGPSAMQVGFQRKPFEAQQARMDLQRGMQKAKQAERFKYDPSTVFRPHSNFAAQVNRDLVGMEADLIRKYEQGAGGNPYQTGSPENLALMDARFRAEQFAAGSIQAKDEFQKALQTIQQNPGKYRPEAIDQFREAYSDPRIATGDIETPVLDDYFDFTKAYNDAIAKVKPDVAAKAFATRGGRNYQEMVETLSPEDVEEVAIGLAGQEDYNRAALRKYQLLTQQSPDQAEQVAQQAADAGRTIPQQMAINEMAPFAFEREKRAITGSGYGAGFQNDQEAASWLVETERGIEDGTFAGMEDVTGEEDLSFFTGYVPSTGNYSITDALNFQISKRTDPDTGKSEMVKIKETLRDNETGRLRMALDDGSVTRWYDPDEFRNVVLPQIAENNKEFKMGAINKYVKDNYGIDKYQGFDTRRGGKKSPTIDDIGAETTVSRTIDDL